jgi:hypothetical protein
LTPEGVAAIYELNAGDAVSLRAQAGYFFVEERSSDDDTGLMNGQLVAEIDAGAVDIVLGGGVFIYDNMKGFAAIYDTTDGFGNTTMTNGDGDEIYANDYELAEGMVKVSFKAGIPVSIYGDYITNMDPSSENTGYLAGITLGKAKAPKSWQFDYNYRDLEADATVGAFTDSDFGGGGTGAKGSKLQMKYQIAKNLQFSASHFINTLASDDDYQRTQIDLIAKF